MVDPNAPIVVGAQGRRGKLPWASRPNSMAAPGSAIRQASAQLCETVIFGPGGRAGLSAERVPRPHRYRGRDADLRVDCGQGPAIGMTAGTRSAAAIQLRCGINGRTRWSVRRTGSDSHVRSVGSGAPLVFVHEFSGDARSWDAQVSFFSRLLSLHSLLRPRLSAVRRSGRRRGLRSRHARPTIWPMWCARSLTARRTSSGCRWAASPPCISALRHPQLARSLVVAGVGYGAKPEQQPQYGIDLQREADHAEAIGMAAFARATRRQRLCAVPARQGRERAGVASPSSSPSIR